jgi:hypothetical protein
MSTSHDQPNLACAQAVRVLCDAPQAAEVCRPDAAPRPPRSVVLPEIVRLSLEGHSSRAISRKTAVPRQTVDRWLRQQRQEWVADAEETAGELFAIARARLEAVYREAMEAWHRCLADKEAMVKAAGTDGDDQPHSVRRTSQSGQASLLGRAIHAAAEIAKFHAKHVEAARRAKTTKRRRARRKLADDISSLPKAALGEIKDLLREIDCFTARRDVDEVAGILCKLSPAEYRKLRKLLGLDYGLALPPRRTAVAGARAEKDEGGRMKDEG